MMFWLVSAYGGSLIGIQIKQSATNASLILKGKLESLGWYVRPNDPTHLENLQNYGEASYATVMDVMSRMDERKVVNASQNPFTLNPSYVAYHRTALNGPQSRPKPKVGTYNKIVPYPEAARKFATFIHGLPEGQRKELREALDTDYHTFVALAWAKGAFEGVAEKNEIRNTIRAGGRIDVFNRYFRGSPTRGLRSHPKELVEESTH